MTLSRLLRKTFPAGEAIIERIYGAVVAQARRPAFYLRLGVPDTLDGRFDMIALHVFLVMRRLKAEGQEGRALSQALTDRFFADLDRSLREMGAGDLGVGRRVKTMAKAFYGRVAAYEAGLNAGDVALRDALARNLYGTAAAPDKTVAAMAAYVRDAAGALAAQGFAAISTGSVGFTPVD